MMLDSLVTVPSDSSLRTRSLSKTWKLTVHDALEQPKSQQWSQVGWSSLSMMAVRHDVPATEISTYESGRVSLGQRSVCGRSRAASAQAVKVGISTGAVALTQLVSCLPRG